MEEVLSTEKEMQMMKKIWREEIINSIYKDSEASTMTIRQLEIQVWGWTKRSEVHKELDVPYTGLG